MFRAALAASILALSMQAAGSGEIPKDPLGSGLWESVVSQFFAGGAVVLDERVRVQVPAGAEDQFQVPVTVDATALGDVEEIVVVADLNPIQKALSFRPGSADAFLGLRLKVEQTTPVRAGVRTSDGVWHVGGAIVEAAGGGCTAPAAAHGQANWMASLGEARGEIRQEAGEASRIMVKIRHPMDTGLADGIPVFHLSRLAFTADSGDPLAQMDVFEPVSENPSFVLRARLKGGGVGVEGRDTEGNEYVFAVPSAPEGN